MIEAASNARPEFVTLTDWLALHRYAGNPPPRRWLVEGIFPLAQPSLVAAGGGIGKSYLLLALTRAVAAAAANDGLDGWINAPKLFGGTVTENGQAVYITAEDDLIEVHNRLRSLGEIPDRLYVVPLPDAGGAVPLFAVEPHSKAPAKTAAWDALVKQLAELPNLRLVTLDPLQPLCTLDLNVPENAQFVCSRLSALAALTGAAIIVSHHFAKREASTPEQAREAIRGTGGLVDGMRAVYALWPPKEDQAKSVCKALGIEYVRGLVASGGVVKANGRANLRVTVFVRDGRGLLCDRSAELAVTKPDDTQLLPGLRMAIADAARDGKPYTKTGVNGVYERRFELPEAFQAIGKHRLVAMVESLLSSRQLIQAMADGSKSVKWLDAPDGRIASGDPHFVTGHIRRGGNESATISVQEADHA